MSWRTGLVAAALGASILAVDAGPAAAATKRTVVACRGSNPTCWPTTFDFAPKGRIFYVERYTGQVRTYRIRDGRHRAWATVGGLDTAGEKGLLGIAVDPRWSRGRRFRWVYLYYTRNGSPDENRIVRYRKRRNGRLIRQLLARIPASTIHNGGVIAFGRDGKLYAVTGDAADPANSQTTSNLAGKVLRMTKGGGTPADNPVISGGRTRIFSYGHRNSFGFTFDPTTRRLWQTENGPGGSCDDEINLIVAGGNFGWGPSGTTCGDSNDSGPDPIPPAWLINPGKAPTGAAFCASCGIPGLEGRLLYGSVHQSAIWEVALDGSRTAIASAPAIAFDNDQIVLGMKRRADGRVYFSDPSGIHRLDP